MAHCGVKRHEVDLSPAGEGHGRLVDLASEVPFDAVPLACASSSRENHSAAISTSRSAFASASLLRRSRSVSLPRDSIKCKMAREISWLLLPFGATRSSTANVL